MEYVIYNKKLYLVAGKMSEFAPFRLEEEKLCIAPLTSGLPTWARENNCTYVDATPILKIMELSKFF